MNRTCLWTHGRLAPALSAPSPPRAHLRGPREPGRSRLAGACSQEQRGPSGPQAPSLLLPVVALASFFSFSFSSVMLQRSLAGRHPRVHSAWEVRADTQLRANRSPDTSRTLLACAWPWRRAPGDTTGTRPGQHASDPRPQPRKAHECVFNPHRAKSYKLDNRSPAQPSPGHVTSQHTWYWPDSGHASTHQTPGQHSHTPEVWAPAFPDSSHPEQTVCE